MGKENKEKISKISASRFYKEEEEITLRFYQTPKALFNNPIYKGLGLGPKLMYSILRDRMEISRKNNWKDGRGYIYLVFSIDKLSELLEIERKTVMRYKKELVNYKLIIDKRLGQGIPNRIYILKPELVDNSNLKSQKGTSRSPKMTLLEVSKRDPNDTNVNDTIYNNVNGNEVFNTPNDKHKHPYRKVLDSKERIADYLAYELEDQKSLGFYRRLVDSVPESTLNHFLAIVKENAERGVVKNKGAYFNKIIKNFLEGDKKKIL